MRQLLIGLLLLGCIQSVHAQLSTVRGKVADTLEKKNLQHAVISLLRKTDSTLFTFTRTDRNGQFTLPNVEPGKYRLLITYPKFADFTEDIEINARPETDLGTIPLTQRTRLLDAVVVRSAGAVRIKGDTTEFVADSFKVREGATVEDLLKRLPGFQVNSKGEVTAQGQRVQKVLVDGEEFFGDDPTMATQNISAKAVDKVQVYDTKTEQQNLTGISSGNEGKTVNIKLKEDAKKGAFGKAHFGTDFERLIDAKALYNKFSGKKKLSLYGTKSDITTGSLTWEDREKLGMEEDYEYDEIGGYYYSFGSSDEFSEWSLRGLPNSYTAGGLFSDKWKDDRNNLNLSYRYNRLATENQASTLTQNILEDTITYNNQYQNTRGLVQQHVGNVKYEWKIDSLASIKLSSAGTLKTNELFSDLNSEYLTETGRFINRSNQVVENEIERRQIDNQLTYRQMFKKKNRLMIATARLGLIEDRQEGVIKTNTSFFDPGGNLDSLDIADQQKLMSGKSRTIGTKITWSEPVTAKLTLVGDYAFNTNSSTSLRNTFNKDVSGKYAIRDNEFSNNFDMDVYSHSGTAIVKYTNSKLRAAVGSGISTIRLKLFDIDSSKRSNYHFLNLTPQASAAYTFKPQTRLSLNYRGTTRQPSIDQLQPIRDNTNRLNIFVGNPNLKVGFNHNINLGFNTYKTLSQKGMFLHFSYSVPVNAIAFNNFVDISKGTRIYTPVNVNGNRNWNFWNDFFKDDSEKGRSYHLGLNGNGGRNVNFVNGSRNITTYNTVNLNLGVSFSKDEKYSFDIRPNLGYNTSKSTFNPDFKNNFWTYGGNVQARVQLPWKIEIATEGIIDLRQRLDAFDTNLNQVIWNADISKKVFKDKSGKIIIVANDILDQRRGFNRNINSNFISEERFSRLSRYFLLKFEWTLSKMPGQNK
ncbi:MAG TPA: TonB-dependent receptor [Flavisolibacter sp.]|nr:TonB-dependent receptor [Flavisolibacter sp.]